jgi:hypothetical protein
MMLNVSNTTWNRESQVFKLLANPVANLSNVRSSQRAQRCGFIDLNWSTSLRYVLVPHVNEQL